MRKYLIIVMSLSLLCISMRVSWAGYQGPTEIFSSSDIASHTGDYLDMFLVEFFVRSDGTYVEPEAGPGWNINVYGASGLLRSFNVSRGADFQATYYFYDQYLYVQGSSKWKDHIYVYDYNGNLVSTISPYSGGFESALPNGDIITSIGEQKYNRYSLSGKLIKAYTSKPLVLGVAESDYSVGDRKYKTTIKFEDKTYSMLMDWTVDESIKIYRDGSDNVYLITSGSVEKYNPCGKLLGEFDAPEDVVFREEYVDDRERKFIKHDEYGEPQIDIYGNVYLWKKTPNKYSILKWTWVDDPTKSAESCPEGKKTTQ